MHDESDRSAGPLAPLSLEESARRLGSYLWLELALFEILGSWVQAVPELDVKLRLGAHSAHHAWHAELWAKRLPVLREMDPVALTRPASDGAAALVDAVRQPAAPEATIEKLVGVYRVLVPATIAAYDDHLARASALSDGPTIRSLGLALADERADGAEGEALLAAMLTGPDEARRAAAHQASLESLAREVGGIVGSAPTPR